MMPWSSLIEVSISAICAGTLAPIVVARMQNKKLNSEVDLNEVEKEIRLSAEARNLFSLAKTDVQESRMEADKLAARLNYLYDWLLSEGIRPPPYPPEAR